MQALNESPDNFTCQLCNSICTNEQSYLQHLNGLKHQRKINQLRVQELIDAKDPSVYCSTCDVTLAPEAMKSHLEGSKHCTAVGVPKPTVKRSISSVGGTGLPTKRPRLGGKNVAASITTEITQTYPALIETLDHRDAFCHLCQEMCAGFYAFTAHLNSPKHIQNFVQIVLDHSAGATASSAQSQQHDFAFFCSLCNVGSANEEQYNEHLNGFKHVYKACGGNLPEDNPFYAKSLKIKEKIDSFKAKRMQKRIVAS